MDTPRPYLSYSQLSCLEWSEKKYIDSYIFQKEREDNEFFRVGKELHKALEERNKKYKSPIKEIIEQIPMYPDREYKIEAKLNDIPLYGIFDGFDKKSLCLADYKTGLRANVKGWTDQMLFYSLMIFLEYNKLPSQIKIFYVKTKWNDDDQLILTDRVQEYEIKVKLKDVIMFSTRVNKAWKRIKELVLEQRQMFGSLPFEKKGRQIKL